MNFCFKATEFKNITINKESVKKLINIAKKFIYVRDLFIKVYVKYKLFIEFYFLMSFMLKNIENFNNLWN
jgi:hypothetical protein